MKTKILLVNALAIMNFLLLISFSYSQWVPQNSSTENNLYSIHFPVKDTGYIAGDAIILKTFDRGENWVIPGSGGLSSTSVFFTDVSTGYSCGGWIRKTINGGISWSTVYSSTISSMNYVWFTDSNKGFAVGQGYMGTGWYAKILKTTNGGSDWSNSPTNPTWPAGGFNSAYFLNSNLGYVVGGWYWQWSQFDGWENPHVFKTTNGGESWLVLDSLFQVETIFNSVYFCTNETGYIVGTNGTIFKTTDGGITWNSQTSGINSDLNEVKFDDINHGYIVGDSGIILKTHDGGENWFTEYSGTTVNLFSIYFPCNDTGYIVGQNGTILQNTNCVQTFIGSNKPSGSFLKIYPNPITSSVTIEFLLQESGFVSMGIYNFIGQEVSNLISDKLSSNKHKIECDLKRLSAGTYFIKLKTKEAIQTKKIIKL
ncbi:MAG: T9SS type A sorting domain-containing protein [Bacteroidetes bacterium]|nr:T9SS type A sorting domain-containing protein [Bacteroidota bacterium]